MLCNEDTIFENKKFFRPFADTSCTVDRLDLIDNRKKETLDVIAARAQNTAVRVRVRPIDDFYVLLHEAH